MSFDLADGDTTAERVLQRASEHFGHRMVFTTAFGLEGSVLLHMIARLRLPIRIVTLDTGLFFEETHRTWKKLEAQLGVRIEAVRPHLSLEEQAEEHGAMLWTREPHRCCDLRKVQPLRRILKDALAWVTGIRRDQTPERAGAKLVDTDVRFGVVKVNPLVEWRVEDVRAYLDEHQVPYNPMFDDGYPSIGCMPCTQRVQDGQDARSGRWAGFDKRECGLHWAHDSNPPVQIGRNHGVEE